MIPAVRDVTKDRDKVEARLNIQQLKTERKDAVLCSSEPPHRAEYVMEGAKKGVAKINMVKNLSCLGNSTAILLYNSESKFRSGYMRANLRGTCKLTRRKKATAIYSGKTLRPKTMVEQ